MKEDFTKRVCHGAPPQMVILGNHVQFHWPMVSSEDEGCSLYKARLAIDTPEGNA